MLASNINYSLKYKNVGKVCIIYLSICNPISYINDHSLIGKTFVFQTYFVGSNPTGRKED